MRIAAFTQPRHRSHRRAAQAWRPGAAARCSRTATHQVGERRVDQGVSAGRSGGTPSGADAAPGIWAAARTASRIADVPRRTTTDADPATPAPEPASKAHLGQRPDRWCAGPAVEHRPTMADPHRITS